MRIFAVGVAGDGENFAIIFQGECGGDERAGTFRCFDDDGDFRKSGDDAISLGKLEFIAGHARWIFAEKSAALFDDFARCGKFPWRDMIESVAEDGNGWQALFERFVVCDEIDAVGETADDLERIISEKSHDVASL